jgi:hypothetical protein
VKPTPLAYPHLSYPRILTPRENAAINAQAMKAAPRPSDEGARRNASIFDVEISTETP